MNYVKKMCILRQVKQGFSGDGKTLSGLIKIEQYGKNLAVEVSIINFAPLVSGEYYCLLSDGRGKTEMLSLRGKSIFNILSDVDISGGFCGIICYVKNEVVPIAYGINGNGSYDWKAILNATLPPVFPKKQERPDGEIARSGASAYFQNEISEANEATVYETKAVDDEKSPPATPPTTAKYNDELVAEENYYEEERRERIQSTKTNENARTENANQNEVAQTRTHAKENGNASGVREVLQKTDEYYLSVKREVDALFAKYPKDKTLCSAFKRSDWVRLRGTAKSPAYLMGTLYEEGKIEYICYALSAEDKDNPPEEIKGVCAFVPASPLLNAEGFFVIFQSAATGECVKPPQE